MSLFRCPVCKGALIQGEHSLCCKKGHSFDLASAGYVNLLAGGGKKGAIPGDNKEMCASRNHFLSKHYYQCLADGLAGFLAASTEGLKTPAVVDAACGEGYYTAEIYRALAQRGRAPRVAGVDISKFALKYAAKRCKGVDFAVASIFEMPLPDHCADIVTNIFAPVADTEFRRVLKKGGLMVIVGPGERHLWELKEFLYEKPYLNEPKAYKFEGFTPMERLSFDDRVHLPCGEDIQNLFAMTPYFWKTPAQATRRLEQLTELDVELRFEAHVFRKNG